MYGTVSTVMYDTASTVMYGTVSTVMYDTASTVMYGTVMYEMQAKDGH
jgi:hypothetical protein